jgi:uncharacterized protein YfaP (DUF2135 family)
VAPRESPLAVTIESPHAGIVPGPTVTLEATVSDPDAENATLVVNGASYPVPIEQGRITQQIVAVPGQNRVGVVVERNGRVARDSLTFRYDGEPMELVILLGWPSRGEIIDLWVREPGGETCKWDHRSTESGGSLLDFSTDAIGFGSQGYVLSEVRPGRYRVKVHYWGSYGDDDARGDWTYRELIGRLDEIDATLAETTSENERRALGEERTRVLERLDAWATPAATQTPVRGEAILFPGTRHERRFRFDVTVHRTGQLTTLGEIEVDAALVAAARRER